MYRGDVENGDADYADACVIVGEATAATDTPVTTTDACTRYRVSEQPSHTLVNRPADQPTKMSQPIHRKHSHGGHTPSKSVTHNANQHTVLPTSRHTNTQKHRRCNTNHSYNQATSTHAIQHVTQDTEVRTSHQHQPRI